MLESQGSIGFAEDELNSFDIVPEKLGFSWQEAAEIIVSLGTNGCETSLVNINSAPPKRKRQAPRKIEMFNKVTGLGIPTCLSNGMIPIDFGGSWDSSFLKDMVSSFSLCQEFGRS